MPERISSASIDGSPRKSTSWGLALGLIAVAGIAARCSPPDASETTEATTSSSLDPDPDALFAEAEALRLAYDEDASQRAIVAYGKARAAWIHQGEHERAARASQKRAATYEQLGRLEDALLGYQEAESLCEGSCDPLLESALASDRGLVQAMLAASEESYESALQQCERALSLARRAGGLPEEAEALSCAGEVEYHRGNLDEALRLHLEARPLRESVADPRGQAQGLFYEGALRSDLSQFPEARAGLEVALSLWTSSQDKRGEAMALTALGRLEQRQGKYQEALNHFRQAVDRLEATGDRVWQASALSGIGGVYFDMGDGTRARPYMDRALESFRNTGLRTAAWDLLLAVGSVHLSVHEPARAVRRFREAFDLAARTGDRWKQSYSLYFMGLAQRSVGERQASLKSLERALELERSTSDPRLEASIQIEIGKNYELLSRPHRAHESFSRALELSRTAADRIGEATALFGRARVAERGNDLDAAKDDIESSLRIIESLRANVESLALRTTYFASIHEFYDLYVSVLMQLHERHPQRGFAADAFAASERMRARSLLESLSEAGVDIRAGVDPVLLEREAALKRRLEAKVERRVRSQSPVESSEAEALEREIRDLESKLDLLRSEIRSKSELYAAITQPKPLRLGDVQKQLLDDDTLLLEFTLGERRSFLWAVSKDTYASFELAPRAEIEQRAVRLYELLTARARAVGESISERNKRLEEADAAYWKAAADLSEILLGPVVDRTAEKKVVVVSDGALQNLPLGALPVPGTDGDSVPMIAAHEIVALPSASTLAVLRKEALGRTRPTGTVAVFADPVFTSDDPRLDANEDTGPSGGGASRSSELEAGASEDGPDIGSLRSVGLHVPRLKATRQEAAAILAMAPSGTTFEAMDFDATRRAVMSPELGKYRIVHFATHGISDVDNPTMSGVLLSMFDRDGHAQDGLLQLNDIYDLELDADLVVLSACSTALGKQIRGEGMVGIVRAFLHAGAERVVATLWKVDDEATRELMTRFYREMLEEHRSPSEALRNAQLAMWHETEWRSPFYWAAFVLQGEWRMD